MRIFRSFALASYDKRISYVIRTKQIVYALLQFVTKITIELFRFLQVLS